MHLSTHSRVMNKAKNEILNLCVTWNQSVHFFGTLLSKIDIDKETYRKNFEQLFEEVERTEGFKMENMILEKEPKLLKSLVKSMDSFNRMENWRANKSKAVIGIFIFIIISNVVWSFIRRFNK